MKAVINIIKSFMRSRFPVSFKILSKCYSDIKRVKTRTMWILFKRKITEEILEKQLRLKSMIKAGDILMVHASLSAIGKVVGGAEAVIRPFQNILTEDGTLLMPSYYQPEPVINLIKSGVPIDLRTAKSSVGQLTEVFRSAQGVSRSSHPFSSVCAWGKYAKYITQGHANSEFICGPGSPLDALYELSGKIMGIGISIGWISIYHLLEDKWEKFPIEVHFPETFSVKYIDSKGNKIERNIKVLDPIVSLTRIEKNEWVLNFITRHMIEKNILHEFALGQAKSWIFDVQLFYQELKNLAQQGITIYTTKEEFNKMNLK
jgi:aminoglycoside 3-N-acetyltransferase